MIINISGELRVNRSDPHNWTLERWHVTKHGKAFWQAQGYHGTLLQALTRALELLVEMNAPEELNLVTLVDAIHTAKKAICSAVGKRTSRR